jgi:hypothetical protein
MPWIPGDKRYGRKAIGDHSKINRVYADEGVEIGKDVHIGVDGLTPRQIIKAFKDGGFTQFSKKKNGGDFYVIEKGPCAGYVVLRPGLFIPDGFRA